MLASLRPKLSRLLNQPPLDRLWAGLAEGSLFQPQILFFHGVEEKLHDERIQVLQTKLEEFEPLMQHLKQRFELIGLDDYHERRQAGDRDLHRCVLLTFDDGYRSNHRLVAPLLRSLGIPWTVYLTTSSIDTGARLPTFVARAALFLTERRSVSLPGDAGSHSLENEMQRKQAAAAIVHRLKTRPLDEILETIEALRGLLAESRWREIEAAFESDAFMNWDEVAELHRAGVSIGAHGHHHVPLHRNLGTDEVARQVHLSRDAIRRRLGRCDHYAFPNGNVEDIGADALAELDRAGFHTAVSTFSAPLNASVHPLLLPRICVYQTGEFQRTILKNRGNGSARRLRAWQQALAASASCQTEASRPV